MKLDRTVLVRASIALAICATLAACGVDDQGQRRMQAAVDSVSKPDTVTAAGEVAGTSTGAATTAMSDANIAAVIATANASEIADGQMAARRAQSADVKAFAKQLVADHGAFQKKIDAAARAAHVTPRPPATVDSMKQHARQADDTLAHLSGAAFDRAWVAHEVAGHQKTMADLQRMQSMAQSQQLRDAIAGGVTTVRGHLEKAQALQSKLGT